MRTLGSCFAMLAILGAGVAQGQCILANPSFEFAGGGTEFAGWNQFGTVGRSPQATHGVVAARLSGPDLGAWGVSGVWQSQSATPGDLWSVRVHAWHGDAESVRGESRALVNVEWRDARGGLIDYATFGPVTAATPPDSFRVLEVVAGPAPIGTASTRLLLGVLQGPFDPRPTVYFDEARFERLGTPTPEEREWEDYPGGRVVDFAGRSWRVKGPGWYDPGPSDYCDAAHCTWVDPAGDLHLTVQESAGSWKSTELALEEALGYGDYVFTTRGAVDRLDPSVVLGLFLWEYGPCWSPANQWFNPHSEIDVEIGRWGDAGRPPGQFVVQPFDAGENLVRFDLQIAADERASFAFRWFADRLEFRAWRGGPADESTSPSLGAWTYRGPHLPRPGRGRVHVNLWQFENPPSSRQEVVLDDFRFVPECVPPYCYDPPTSAAPPTVGTWLGPARPNPSNPSSSIDFELAREGTVRLRVHDLAGRHVRTLVDGWLPAGPHRVRFDGRDEAGGRVASGVYLYRLRTADRVLTGRLALVR